LGSDGSPALVLDDAPDRQVRAVRGVDEPLRDPAALDGHAGLRGAKAVERRLQLRLEEQVARLPARPRRDGHVEAQQRLAVAPEPLVVAHGDHLLRERRPQPERLQQPHDLVVEVHRARQAVDLA
jgi:hypothetical protein